MANAKLLLALTVLVAVAACGGSAGLVDDAAAAGDAGAVDDAGVGIFDTDTGAGDLAVDEGVGLDSTAAEAEESDGGNSEIGTLEPDEEWATWPMPNPPSTGLPNPQSYTVMVDTVIDNVTGLVWQVRPRAYDVATDPVAYCQKLQMAGRDDWRLPRQIELLSLIDFTRFAPAADAAFAAFLGDYVSSTVSMDGVGHATVDVTNGSVSPFSGSPGIVCVAGGRSHPPLPHYSATEGTVRDNWTGLTWQRRGSIPALTFVAAQSYCADLPLEGGGWRLPSLNELQSLVLRPSSSIVSLDATYFERFPPGTQYWTSSAIAGASGDEAGWVVIFTFGGWTGFVGRDATQNVRCVR